MPEHALSCRTPNHMHWLVYDFVWKIEAGANFVLVFNCMEAGSIALCECEVATYIFLFWIWFIYFKELYCYLVLECASVVWSPTYAAHMKRIEWKSDIWCLRCDFSSPEVILVIYPLMVQAAADQSANALNDKNGRRHDIFLHVDLWACRCTFIRLRGMWLIIRNSWFGLSGSGWNQECWVVAGVMLRSENIRIDCFQINDRLAPKI